jgi:hypothetical protein
MSAGRTCGYVCLPLWSNRRVFPNIRFLCQGTEKTILLQRNFQSAVSQQVQSIQFGLKQAMANSNPEIKRVGKQLKHGYDSE